MSVIDGSTVTVKSGYYFNNTAYHGYGGVVYIYRDSNITVSNSSFDNNEAGSNGGVMYVVFNSSIAVGNSSFVNNVYSRQ